MRIRWAPKCDKPMTPVVECGTSVLAAAIARRKLGGFFPLRVVNI